MKAIQQAIWKTILHMTLRKYSKIAYYSVLERLYFA